MKAAWLGNFQNCGQIAHFSRHISLQSGGRNKNQPVHCEHGTWQCFRLWLWWIWAISYGISRGFEYHWIFIGSNGSWMVVMVSYHWYVW